LNGQNRLDSGARFSREPNRFVADVDAAFVEQILGMGPSH
jgi:hypothetical protein